MVNIMNEAVKKVKAVENNKSSVYSTMEKYLCMKSRYLPFNPPFGIN